MYVDLQVNGYIGVDFTVDGLTLDDFRRAAEALMAAETDVFLPTIITAPAERIARNIGVIADAVAREGWEKHIPGVHLEGPFISAEPGAVGAHPGEYVLAPDSAQLDAWGAMVKMITVAAEAPGADALIRHATARGIVVSLGHQLALTPDLERAAAAGAKTLTHLGNGLPNLIHRHHNPIWSGLACDALTAMIITDGHHLPPEMIQCFIRCKGVERIIVTSDASPAAGLPPGEYNFLGLPAVLEPDGRLHNPERQCLVGSSATIRDCMKHLASLDLLTDDELRRVGRDNALALLNRGGSL